MDSIREKVTVPVKCRRCGQIVKLRVYPIDIDRYNTEGLLAQDAFPYLAPEKREILISGVCPDCWDDMF